MANFSTVAGIIEICLACITMIFGSLFTILSLYLLSDLSFYMNPQEYFMPLAVGLFGIFAFAIGLWGGISSLKRKRFLISVSGIVLIMLWSLLVIILMITSPTAHIDDFSLTSSFWQGFIIGIPMILFSIVDLSFLLAARD